jgi:hypothetical protein
LLSTWIALHWAWNLLAKQVVGYFEYAGIGGIVRYVDSYEVKSGVFAKKNSKQPTTTN